MSQSASPKPQLAVQIRWMIRRDMPDVLRIERESFEFDWTEEDFLNCLRQRNCIGMVAEHDGRVVGFMVYCLHKTRLQLLNFAVASSHRHFGIGRQLVDKLVNKLSQQRRQEILVELRETNLSAQLFFHTRGFRAVGVARSHFDDTGEDAFVFSYRLDGDYRDLSLTRGRISRDLEDQDEWSNDEDQNLGRAA